MINSSNSFIWVVIIGMAVLTFLLRFSFIALLDKIALPPVVVRGLQYVPAAVFSALVAPALLYDSATGSVALWNPRLLAGLVAAVVAWRTRNILLTITVGMLVLWLVQWVMQ
jgi:branched-subunit amino acid transport protein